MVRRLSRPPLQKGGGRHSPDDGSLANAEAGDEAPGIDGAQVPVGAADHEDGDAHDPEHAEEARGHDAADAVAHDEGAGRVNWGSRESDMKATHIRAPPTEPIWTMAETLALMLACSTGRYSA